LLSNPEKINGKDVEIQGQENSKVVQCCRMPLKSVKPAVRLYFFPAAAVILRLELGPGFVLLAATSLPTVPPPSTIPRPGEKNGNTKQKISFVPETLIRRTYERWNTIIANTKTAQLIQNGWWH